MLAGRAGVIAASHARKYELHRGSVDEGQPEQTDFLNNYKRKCKDVLRHNTLEFIQYPLAAWSVGIIMIIVGGYLIYHVSMGEKEGTIFSGFRQGYWWQYLIAIAIVLLGISFLLVVKAERVIFNKQRNLVIVTKKSFCALRSKENTRVLNKVISIQIVKRGHDSISNKTIHYKILLHFTEERKLEILETNSKTKIKKRYIEIKVFLCQEIENASDIHIIDESTNNRGFDDNRV